MFRHWKSPRCCSELEGNQGPACLVQVIWYVQAHGTVNGPRGLECLALLLASLSKELLPLLLAALAPVPASSPRSCQERLRQVTRCSARTHLPRRQSCSFPCKKPPETTASVIHAPGLAAASRSSWPWLLPRLVLQDTLTLPLPKGRLPPAPCQGLPALRSARPHCVPEELPCFRAHIVFLQVLISYLCFNSSPIPRLNS